MRTKDNIYFHEWMGMTATVYASVNRNEIGISGTVCDETKNTVTVRSGEDLKHIIKSGRMFELGIGDRKFKVNGSYSGFRPENRIKERRRIEKMLRNGD